MEKLILRHGLFINLFGTDIEKEVENLNAGLRQTNRARTTTSKTSTSKKKRRRISRSKTEGTTTITEQNPIMIEEDLTELEEQLAQMEDLERDYILKIEDLERKMITLMKNKTDSSIKSSSSLFSKFKRSLTLEKKNVVITRKLAEIGGSGAGVFSCLVDGWKCAMKELDTAHMTQGVIDNFLGEIQLLELLPQHENISRYLFHEINNNRIRLFMTQYHGSLGSYIQHKKNPFSPSEIWKICLDTIKGIEFLHNNGIIHRDLKSDNIFILLDEKNEILKCAIGDFDTAKQINSKYEQAKTVLGTPAWMAPEVMDAKELGSYSYSADGLLNFYLYLLFFNEKCILIIFNSL